MDSMPPVGLQVQPVIPVLDIEEANAYFTDILGFGGAWTYGNPPTQGGVSMQSAALQFTMVKPDQIPVNNLRLWIHVSGIENLEKSLKSRGAVICDSLEINLRGLTEFAVQTPFKIVLVFAERPLGNRTAKRDDLDDVIVEVAFPDPQEFRELMASCGWEYFTEESGTADALTKPHAMIIAKHHGKLIANVSIEKAGNGFLYLDNVCVRPEYRTNGVGSRLMLGVDEWLKDNPSLRRLQVSFFCQSDRVPFYQKFGYLGPESSFIGMFKFVDPKK